MERLLFLNSPVQYRDAIVDGKFEADKRYDVSVVSCN